MMKLLLLFFLFAGVTNTFRADDFTLFFMTDGIEVELLRDNVETDLFPVSADEIDFPSAVPVPEIPADLKIPDFPKTVPIEAFPADGKIPDFPKTVPIEAFPADPAQVKDLSESELEQLFAFIADLRKCFIDPDNLMYHPVSDEQNSHFKKWIRIYKDFESKSQNGTLRNPEHVPCPTGIRIISFTTIPSDENEQHILDENLAYYKAQSYNVVLFRLTSHLVTEDVVQFVNTLKSKGFAVWGCYDPGAYIEGITLPDPDVFLESLRKLAPVLDGWILGWGRTSCHMFLQDRAYIMSVVSALRTGNPSIPVAGELYYGNSVRNRNERIGHWSRNSFPEASAEIIQGRGFNGIDAVTVLAKTKLPAIAVVVGSEMNFLAKSQKTWKDHRKDKVKLENAFLRAGCIGTITEHADGNNTISLKFKRILYNDLCKTLYSGME